MTLPEKTLSKKVGGNIVQQNVLTAWPGQILAAFSSALNAY